MVWALMFIFRGLRFFAIGIEDDVGMLGGIGMEGGIEGTLYGGEVLGIV